MVERALVLSGGGAKGIYEVGCLRELLRMDQQLDFDFFLGVSAGSLNAAYLAQAPMAGGFGSAASRKALTEQVERLEEIWKTVDEPRDIYIGDATPGLAVLAEVAFGRDSILDARPIRQLIDQHISTQAALASRRKFHIGATSLKSGKYVAFTETTPGLDLKRAVKASAAVPAMFSPVEYGADLLVDGAIRDNTPLSHAYKAQPNREIIVIQTSPIAAIAEPQGIPTVPYQDWDMDGGPLSGGDSALDVLERAANIMADEVQQDDLEGAQQWNAAIKALQQVAAAVGNPAKAKILAAIKAIAKHHVPVRVYAPHAMLLRNELVFKPTDVLRMYLQGKSDAAAPRLTF